MKTWIQNLSICNNLETKALLGVFSKNIDSSSPELSIHVLVEGFHQSEKKPVWSYCSYPCKTIRTAPFSIFAHQTNPTQKPASSQHCQMGELFMHNQM